MTIDNVLTSMIWPHNGIGSDAIVISLFIKNQNWLCLFLNENNFKIVNVIPSISPHYCIAYKLYSNRTKHLYFTEHQQRNHTFMNQNTIDFQMNQMIFSCFIVPITERQLKKQVAVKLSSRCCKTSSQVESLHLYCHLHDVQGPIGNIGSWVISNIL